MKNEDIKYFKKLWHIQNKIVELRHKDCISCNRLENITKEWCYYIEPVYIYSINTHWNGEVCFDICPRNKQQLLNNNDNWGWKLECSTKDVDNFDSYHNIFSTKQKAIEYFNKKYTPEQRKIYKRLLKI